MTCFCCSGETIRRGFYRNKNFTVQRFKCLRCNKSYSEKQPLEGLRVEFQKVCDVVNLLVEGMGIRAISRFTGLHCKTVLAILEMAGTKCAELLDAKVRNLAVSSLQVDEIWGRVGMRQNRTEPSDKENGDMYTFIALEARTKLIISHHTGKRDYENTDLFVKDLESRMTGRVQITTDGWLAYPDVIRNHLLYRLDYAVVHKVYGPEQGCPDSLRRYSPHVCTAMHIKVKAGAPRKDRINTSFVERCNLSMRHFNKRFVRLGLGYSRKLENHKHSIAIFVAAYNFCKVHSTLGCTPAVGSQLTDHTWTIAELLGCAAFV